MAAIAASLMLALSLALQTTATQTTTAANDELWAAARAGDVAAVTRALDRGADVNAKTRYGVTALTFAADKGHLAVVMLLLDRGADVNVVDTFYKGRAIDMAAHNEHFDVVLLLLKRGSKGAPEALRAAVRAGNAAVVQEAMGSSEVTPDMLQGALAAARSGTNTEITKLLEDKAAAAPPAVAVDRATLQSYTGTYREEASGTVATIVVNGDTLSIVSAGYPTNTLVPTSRSAFRNPDAEGVTYTFSGPGGAIDTMVMGRQTGPLRFSRIASAPAAVPAPPAAAAAAASAPAPRTVTRTAPKPWPGFRGDNAAGNGDGQGAATEWDIASGRHIGWKTEIPGISNASPIVWGNRVFVVTAISAAGDKTFRTGLYGDVAPAQDLSEHTWKIYCLDKSTGKILWDRIAFTGLPKVKRHPKASQANSTPVTDGKRVVALFGSIGKLIAWDVNGRPLWTRDIGVLDSGWFFDPDYQWGHSSSPIIHGNTVIVQADVQKKSFLAAYDLATGKDVWHTDRDEISTWGTPTIFRGGGRELIVTNGPKVRGYDPTTGKLVWTLGPNSEITVGTPVVGDGLVFITGGYPPVRPVYAVRPTASGDISLPASTTSSDAIAWSNGEGTYIPTPLFYEGILYTFNITGVLTAYRAKTGERLYRARVGGGGSFAASPIAADGKLYFASEDGDIIVARAGPAYEELAKNTMKDVIMSTPAISDGTIIVRTIGHVYGVVGDR